MLQRIGRYEVLDTLGQGAFAAVYRARDVDLDREVALKVFPRAADRSGRAVARFQREAQVLARLDHPNIVGVHEAGEERGMCFLAMDLIDGSSLQDVIERRGPLEVRQAAGMFRDLAEALASAHDSGFVHRDIKPGNILIARDGRALLTDFGLAGLTFSDSDGGRLSRSGTLMGTPGYCPPEQASGELVRVGPASDVYGLGAALYAALVGRPPIEGDDLLEVLVATRERMPVAPSKRRPGVSRELDAIVLTCLAKSPEERYPTARALAGALDAFLSGRRAPIVGRRSLPLIATALGLAALGLTTVLVAALRPSPAEEPRATPGPSASAPDDRLERAERLIQAGDAAAALTLLGEALDRGPDPQAHLLVGRARAALRDPVGAEAALDEALAANPELADALYERGLLRAARNDGVGARADLERFVELRPDDVRGLETLSAVALAQEDYARVEELASHSLALDPNRLSARCQRAMARAHLDRHAEAEQDLAAAVALDPQGSATLRASLEVAFRAGRHEEAIRLSTRLLEQLPNDATLRETRGRSRYLVGDVAGSAEDMELALRVDPDRPSARVILGQCLVQLKQYAEAEQVLRVGLGGPHPIDQEICLGVALLYQGEREAALAQLDSALRLDPEHGRAHGFRGMALRALQRYPEAAAELALAAERVPKDASFPHELGRVLREMHRPQEALEALAEALRREPERPLVARERAEVLHEAGDYAGARQALEAILERTPDDADCWQVLGEILVAQNEQEQALTAYDRALELAPDEPVALLNRAAIHIRRSDYERAMADLDRLLTVSPDDAKAHINRSVVLSRLERYEEALLDLDRAVELAPGSREAWFNRGINRDRACKFQGAVEDFTKALEVSPDWLEAHVGRGYSRERARDYPGALADFDRALELMPAEDRRRASIQKERASLLEHMQARPPDEGTAPPE